MHELDGEGFHAVACVVAHSAEDRGDEEHSGGQAGCSSETEPKAKSNTVTNQNTASCSQMRSWRPNLRNITSRKMRRPEEEAREPERASCGEGLARAIWNARGGVQQQRTRWESAAGW